MLTDGLISDDQLRQALERQRQSGGFLGEILATFGFVEAGKIKPYLEEITGFPFVEITEEEIDMDVVSLFPEAIVTARKALPYQQRDGKILVAMVDPLNLGAVDALKSLTDLAIVPHLALESDLMTVIKRAYDVRHKTQQLLNEMGSVDGLEADASLDGLPEEAAQAPIVRLVTSIISGAVSARASDIHIEPQESSVRVRYRIDGIMYEQMTVPRNHHAACISRLKILSGLDISERRRPQDGRFTTAADTGEGYDVRLSIMPTVHGEKACMRLLEKSNKLARVEKLGFLPEQRTVFEKFIKRPHGLVLVTGPTGSGKTTTLYAALQMINNPSLNINTVEDPVEYKLGGINQMQVNPKIGVTFAGGLRTLVRQDPDVILVGEIRDGETAEIAVQAALTGHLVLSTLHTNDAAGALVRLQNMGVERFLVSSAVVGIVAQRLLRLLCPHCRESYTPTLHEAEAAGLPIGSSGDPPSVARARGCKRCGGLGTAGRTAATEIMPMTDKLRELVLAGASAQAMADQAIAEGLVTMRQAAIRKTMDLTVSIPEVMRVFAEDE